MLKSVKMYFSWVKWSILNQICLTYGPVRTPPPTDGNLTASCSGFLLYWLFNWATVMFVHLLHLKFQRLKVPCGVPILLLQHPAVFLLISTPCRWVFDRFPCTGEGRGERQVTSEEGTHWGAFIYLYLPTDAGQRHLLCTCLGKLTPPRKSH